MIDKTTTNYILGMSGGGSDKNIQKLLEKGADVLVAGNHVFKSENPIETIAKLKNF